MTTAVRWLFAFAACLVGPLNPAHTADQPKPNILFCFADDWGRYARAYAALEASRRQQRRQDAEHRSVAARGVLFRNAFVPAPSCTPCRSSLLSGRYFFNTGRGAILQGAVWDESIPTFPLLLRDAGYHIGKTPRSGAPARRPTRRSAGSNTPTRRPGWGSTISPKRRRRPSKDGKTRRRRRASEMLDASARATSTAFLKARDAKKPCFFWFGPTTRHRKWIKGSGKALWDIDPDIAQGQAAEVPARRAGGARGLRRLSRRGAGVRRLRRRAAEAARRTPANSTARSIVISGDHGMPGVPGGKCNLYDFGIGVALVAAVAGRARAGRVVDDFVSLMDLAPTFLEIGGVKPPGGTERPKSLVAGAEVGEVRAGRSAIAPGS